MRKSLSSVGLGLSLVFGLLLLALMTEIYYLLWWKRRWNNNNRRDQNVQDEYNNNPAREVMFFYKLCWNTKPASIPVRSALPHHQLIKPLNATAMGQGDGTEAELLGIGGGLQRCLFTIKEETKEDLASEDAKSIGMDDVDHLNDVNLTKAETPYMTPQSSPQFFFTPPVTPMTTMSQMGTCSSLCSPGGGNGYNPFLESSTDAEFNRMKASPPPFFKFLRDAEEKLVVKKKREQEEEERLSRESVRGVHCNGGSFVAVDGSFLRIIVEPA